MESNYLFLFFRWVNQSIVVDFIRRTFENIPQETRANLRILWKSPFYTPHALAAERRVHLGVVHDDHRGVGAAVGHLGQALAVVRDVERAFGVLLLVVNGV